jgi:hypothetical protein
MTGTAITTLWRIFQAVRINSVEITTSISASVEWLSAYSPTTATLVTGTSTTSAGDYLSRPPKNSLASLWSLNGSNESESLLRFTFTQNDYLTVNYSAVFQDDVGQVSVTTAATAVAGQVYVTYFDGPRTGATFAPVGRVSIN